MFSTMLKAKLHFARITKSDLNYEGSLLIDEDLMDAVGIANYEKILVSNAANGKRFETYAIAGERGSRVIGLNGAAAHMGEVGDRIIVFTFCQIPTDDIPQHHPRVLVLDENNEQISSHC